MDWYFGSGIDDLVVPKDQELSDRLPSPDSWSKWGINTSESFHFPLKCLKVDAISSEEENNFNHETSRDVVEMEICGHDQNQPCASSVGGRRSVNESFRQAAPLGDLHDFQLDGLAGFELTDDIFLDSILEDLPDTENLHKSFCFSNEPPGSVLQSEDLLTDITSGSRSMLSGAHSLGSSKYLKARAFPPSNGWENSDISASQIILSISEQKDSLPIEALLEKGLVHLDCDHINRHSDEERTVGESVLHELEMVMSKLTEKTRICFRDAFYRLAKDSRRGMVIQNQNGGLTLENSSRAGPDEKKRCAGIKTMEAETNTIDRAIASLLFNKMDLNVRESLFSASSGSKQDTFRASGSPNSGSSQLQACSRSHYPTFLGDAEVPVLGQGYLDQRAIKANATM